MKLTQQDIQKLAQLARIHINADEAESTLVKLSGILSMIDTMQTVDTSNITPMAHTQSVTQRLRTDTITENNHRDTLQSIAPSIHNGLYLVPKVIE